MTKIQDDSPTTEAPVEETPDYSYEEVHNKSAEEIVADKPEVAPEATETPETPETPEVPEEKVEEPQEPAIDPKQMVEDISNQVMEKLRASDESKNKVQEDVKDEYEKFAEKIQRETGRPPTWKEALEFVKESAVTEIKAEQEAEQKRVAEQAENDRKATEQIAKKLNAGIDEELEELYKRNELSPIKDKTNPSDQGVVERKALFQKMLDVNQERQAQGKDPILSVQRIFYGYYQKPSAQPAGEDAPVSMGKGSATAGEQTEELDYIKDVHSKDWNNFRKG